MYARGLSWGVMINFVPEKHRSTFAFPTDVCSETCIPIAQLVMSISSVAAVGVLVWFFWFFSPPPALTLSDFSMSIPA